MSIGVSDLQMNLNVGLYDPFSIFQGGFRSDFEKHVNIQSFYWKDNQDCMKVLKNINFNFKDEIPHTQYKDLKYLRFMFISCQSIDDYRAKVRPLVLQWLSSIKSINPTVPYFIIFFENSELRTATDKYLKTNIFNKLKIDFDNKEFETENIFKVKSIYPLKEDRIEAWKNITTSIKSLLQHSINTQLTFYNEDLIKTATIFQDLSQYDSAMACYSKLFNKTQYLPKSEFENIDIDNTYKIIKNEELPSDASNFTLKLYYYHKQRDLLMLTKYTDLVFIKNLCILAQTLIGFLNSLEMCYKKNEISFILVNEFLNNERLSKLIEDTQIPNADLLTYIGRLKLLQRNELIALGTSKCYSVKGSMTLVDVQSDIEAYTIQNEKLTRIFTTEKSFIDYIIELTREIISIYDNSVTNSNTLATLSTELALILFYSTDDYETSCDQLAKSYNFFFETGWKYIGLSLLEIYIANLDKLVDTHGDSVIFQLLSSYINLMVNKSAKFEEEKFCSLCVKLPRKHTMKIENLFKLKEASNVYCDESDIYKIKISMNSKIACNVDKVRLIMRNKDNNIVEFVASQVLLEKNNDIILLCSKLLYGDFKATNMIISVGNLEINQPVNFKFNIVPLETYIDKSSDQVMYNTSAIVRIPKLRFLNSDKILFETIVGSSEIANLELTFIKTDPDKLDASSTYQMNSYKDDSYETIDIDIIENEKTISFKPKAKHVFTTGTIVFVEIPYYFPPDVSNTILDVYYAIKFDSIKGNDDQITCSLKYFTQIESSLPIAVAADETIKSIKNMDESADIPSFAIFSNFTINSISIEHPVRIQSVSLVPKGCEIESWKLPRNIIAFMDQGTTFFYKITDFVNGSVLLQIKYNTIKDEILCYLNMNFIAYLEANDASLLQNVNFSSVKSIVSNIWKSFDFKLNMYALSGTIFILNRDDVDVGSFFAYFDPDYKDTYINHIGKFLDSLNSLKVDENFKSLLYSSVQQELDIPVSLPELNIINIVDYKFDRMLQYLVCEPIDIEINLDVHLLKFFGSQVEEFDLSSSNEKKVRFQSSYGNIEPDNDTYANLEISFSDYDQKWIISGLKTLEACVNLKELMKKKCLKYKFKLTLVPLKVGKLILPSIEVKNKSNLSITMDLDYKNISESILVVSELNKIIHSF